MTQKKFRSPTFDAGMTILSVGPEKPPPPLSLTFRGTCSECQGTEWQYVTDPDEATRIIGWRCAGCGSQIRNDEAIGFGQGRSPGAPTRKRPPPL